MYKPFRLCQHYARFFFTLFTVLWNARCKSKSRPNRVLFGVANVERILTLATQFEILFSPCFTSLKRTCFASKAAANVY